MSNRAAGQFQPEMAVSEYCGGPTNLTPDRLEGLFDLHAIEAPDLTRWLLQQRPDLKEAIWAAYDAVNANLTPEQTLVREIIEDADVLGAASETKGLNYLQQRRVGDEIIFSTAELARSLPANAHLGADPSLAGALRSLHAAMNQAPDFVVYMRQNSRGDWRVEEMQHADSEQARWLNSQYAVAKVGELTSQLSEVLQVAATQVRGMNPTPERETLSKFIEMVTEATHRSAGLQSAIAAPAQTPPSMRINR